MGLLCFNAVLVFVIIFCASNLSYSYDYGDSPMFFGNKLKVYNKPPIYQTIPEKKYGGLKDGGGEIGGGEIGGEYGEKYGGKYGGKYGEKDGGEDGGKYGVKLGVKSGGGTEFGKLDNVKVTMTKESQIVRCKSGYTLLSCGVDPGSDDDRDSDNNNNNHYPSRNNNHNNNNHNNNNNNKNNNQVHLTYTHPIDSTTCACFTSTTTILTNPKLQCQAWCHKTPIYTTTIASNKLLFTSMTSKCPKSSKVLGCHMQFSAGTKDNQQPTDHFFYPVDNGKSCFCKDFVGAKCISTCVQGAEGYSVVRSVPGESHARCPEGSFATGCGVSQATGEFYNSTSAYPSAHVSSPSSCSCYYPVPISSSPSAFFSTFSSSFCYAVCAEKLCAS